MKVLIVLKVLGVMLTCISGSVDLRLPKIKLSLKNNDTFYPLNEMVNTEMVVNAGDMVLMECSGKYPVVWRYEGNGIPLMTSNTSSYRSSNDMTFRASVSIQSSQTANTGKYICNYAEFPSVASYFYIYVPGDQLFTSNRRQNIKLEKSDPLLNIPCSVTHPDTNVTLYKIFRRGLMEKLPEHLAIYNPRNGFTIRSDSLEIPNGTYVCSASHYNLFRVLDFNVQAAFNNSKRVEPVITTEPSILPKSHPCSSFRCPYGSECALNPMTELPFCRCTKRLDLLNDLRKQCFVDCENDFDCFDTEKCSFESGITSCQDVCKNVTCGRNSYCTPDLVKKHYPRCQCRQGYAGNPSPYTSTECTPIPIPSSEEATSYCSVANCGPNSRCIFSEGKYSCACKENAVGMPPNCESVCHRDEDCPFSKACSKSNICEEVCHPEACGKNAICRVVKRRPNCMCEINYNGDPKVICYQNPLYLSRISTS